MTDLGGLTPDETIALERAKELRGFAAGFEDAGGHPELLRRARLLATDVVDLTTTLKAERGARQSIQGNRDQLMRDRFPGAA